MSSIFALPLVGESVAQESQSAWLGLRFVACVASRASPPAPFVFTPRFPRPLACLRARAGCTTDSPGHHDEEVQAVPRVSEVTLLAKNPQSHHLDHHLHGEEGEDEVIEVLQRKEGKPR